MKKVYMICALSCSAFCYAMNRNETEQRDLTAICILKCEDKICKGVKSLISSPEKKDLQKKKDEEKKQKIDVPQVGKSIIDQDGRIIMLPLPESRRFGRGSSGPGEGQYMLEVNAKL